MKSDIQRMIYNECATKEDFNTESGDWFLKEDRKAEVEAKVAEMVANGTYKYEWNEEETCTECDGTESKE